MARRRLLTEDQWARLLAVPDDERAMVRHYTLSRDDLDIVTLRRTAHTRLGCAILLCYLHHPGRIPGPDERPPIALLAFVARQVGAEPDDFIAYSRRDQNRREQVAAIMARTGHRAFDRTLFRDLAAWLTSKAQIARDPIILATTLIDEFRRRRILIPSAAILELMLHQARGRAERVLHRALVDGIDQRTIDALDRLLTLRADTEATMLAWLRRVPAAPTARNMLAVIERLSALKELGIDRSLRARVPEVAFERLAAEGLRMTPQHLQDLATSRRRAVLAATAIRLEMDLTDVTLSMFDKLIGSLARKAERRTAENTLRSVRDTQIQLRVLLTACKAVIGAREAGADPYEAVDQGVGWFRFMKCVTDSEALAKPEIADPRTEMLGRYATVRAFAPTLLNRFSFLGSQSVTPLLRALDTIRVMYAAGRRTLPEKPPTGFIRRSWRPFVIKKGGIDRKAYEICALSELRDRLRAGDVWVEGSRQYRDFESCLMPRPTFDILCEEGALPVAVPRSADGHLAGRGAELDRIVAEVADLAEEGLLEDVDLSDGELRVTPIRDTTPPEAEELSRRAYDLMPRIKVTDLLLEVDGWTDFSGCFTHQRSGRPADDRAAALTTVLADGINLGLSRMSEACRGSSMRQLAWMHDWHVRDDTYMAALARIIDTHRALPLAAVWGDGRTSSSDGQFYRAGGRGEAVGDVNAHHGNEPGIAFYTHVSDQYGPFHTKVIAATASEAPHVIDGLLHHQSGLDIEEHYTDTGGAVIIWTFGSKEPFEHSCDDIGHRGPSMARIERTEGQSVRYRLVSAAGEPVPIVQDFLAHLLARGCSPNTVTAYAFDLRHLWTFLEASGLPWNRMLPPDAIGLLAHLRSVAVRRRRRAEPSLLAAGGDRVLGLSAAAINRALAAAASLYEFAIVAGRLDGPNPLACGEHKNAVPVTDRHRPFLDGIARRSPIRRGMRVRTALRLPRPLEPEQVAALVGCLRCKRDLALVRLMLDGGLRPGEALALRVADVAYGRRRVVIRHDTEHPKGVRPKSRTERVVDLHEPETLAAVADYMMSERPVEADSPYLFLVGGHGRRRLEPLSYAALAKLFARAAARAGIREAWVTPHALRHTHATRMWEGGMRELALQRRLGHASPVSTRIYTRVSDAAVVAEYRRAVGLDREVP